MSFSKWASIASTCSSFKTQMQYSDILCYWFAVLHSHASHWLTKQMAQKNMALRFRIIEQYLVNTKFDDAVKILVTRERWPTDVDCQYTMCKSLRAAFLSCISFTPGDIFFIKYCFSAGFRRQDSRLDFERGVAKMLFLSLDRPF